MRLMAAVVVTVDDVRRFRRRVARGVGEGGMDGWMGGWATLKG